MQIFLRRREFPYAGRGFNPRPAQGWNDPPPLNIRPQFQNWKGPPRKMNLLIDSHFLSVVTLLSRGWIVPVGGSTPDRHQADRHSPILARFVELNLPRFSVLEDVEGVNPSQSRGFAEFLRGFVHWLVGQLKGPPVRGGRVAGF